MKGLTKLMVVTALSSGAAVITQAANASDYGCKALLCFAGGQGLPECAATVSQVYKDLAKGRGFPQCDLSDGNDSSQNYAQLTQMPRWDNCPTGTTPLYNTQIVVDRRIVTSGSGNSSLACVSGSPTLVRTGFGSGMFSNGFNTPTYTKSYPNVIWLPPQSTNGINVFTNGKLFTTVRY